MSNILKPTINITNIIKIPRSINKEIIAYKIYVSEDMSSEIKNYLYKTVPTPVSPNPILEKNEYTFTYDGEIQLEDNIYYSTDYPIKVITSNNEELDLYYYDYDEDNKILKIDTDNPLIKEKETFYISAYYDEIVVKHTVSNNCKYSIVPVTLPEDYGSHYLLK